MEITGEDYRVVYDKSTHTVFFHGMMRLRGAAEYAPVTELLDKIVEEGPSVVVLDLYDLQFLNSSGINFLFRFVIQLREQQKSQLEVLGSSQIAWQEKSLPNLLKLMEHARLQWR